MDIIVFYLPSFFREAKPQIAYYTGSKYQNLLVLVSNVVDLAEIRKTATDTYLDWLALNKPENMAWKAKLRHLAGREVRNPKERKIKLSSGAPGFSSIDGTIIVSFKKELPEKYYLF